MIFDKTRYRLQQLEKKLKAAHSDSAKASVQKSIDKYTKKGEECAEHAEWTAINT